MFTPEFFIEAFQSTKKTIIRRITNDKEIHAMADRYVDSQTQFAKMILSNMFDGMKYSINKTTQCIFSTEKSEVSAPYKVEKETN